jgi:tetratricopeptide (TPR) repeat protein
MPRRAGFDLDTLARRALIALCALAPFFYIPVAGVTVFQAKALLSALLLLVAALSWALARYADREVRVPHFAVVAAALAPPLAYLVSALVHGFGSFSLVGTGVEQDTLVAYALASGALVLSVLVFSGEEAAPLTALRAFIAGAALLALFELVHVLVPALPLSSAIQGQAGNPLGNWHEVAILLGLSGFLGAALLDTVAARGKWRYLLIAAAVMSVPVLILADFADAWCLLALLCFSMFVYARRRVAGWRRSVSYRPLAWLVCGSLCLALMLWGSMLVKALPAQLQVTSLEARPSWQATYKLAGQTLTSAGTVLFGTGPGTFVRDWSRYKPSSVNQTPFWDADFGAGIGSLPTSLVTAGVLGALAWLALLAALAWAVFGALRGERYGFAAPIILVSGLGTLYLFAFHVWYVPQAGLHILSFLFAGIFIALAAGAERTEGLTVRLSRFDGWKSYAVAFFAGVCLLGVAASALLSLRMNLAEAFVNRSILAYSGGRDLEGAARLLRYALFIYGGDDRAHRAGIELGILQMQRLSASGDTSAAARAQLQALLAETIQHGIAAVSIDSGDYQNWLELAGLYQSLGGASVQGAYDSARAAYENALQADPLDPLIYVRLGQLDVVEGQHDAALADLTTALTLKPDLAAAYYLRSQVYASVGRMQESYADALQATVYAPDDPLSWYNAGVVTYARGDATSTIAHETRALALEPQYADALYVLGLAQFSAGEKDAALATFTSLSQLDPNEPGIRQILMNLRTGRSPLYNATTTPASVPRTVQRTQ